MSASLGQCGQVRSRPEAAGLPGGLAVESHSCRQIGILARFWRDRSGTVGMTFGLLIIPLTAFVGLAIDFGRVYSVNAHTQSALDAAALAAGRVAQVEPNDTINKALAAATAYFNQAKPSDVISSSIEFSPNAQSTQFTVTATSWVRTPFLGVLNSLYHQGAGAGAPAGCQGNYYADHDVHRRAQGRR